MRILAVLGLAVIAAFPISRPNSLSDAAFVPGRRLPHHLPLHKNAKKSRGHGTSATSVTSIDDGAAARTGDGCGGRDMESLRDWLATRGFDLADGVELTSVSSEDGDDGENWGISLQTSAEAGTPILRVPKSMILSSTFAADDESNLGDTSTARASLRDSGVDDHFPEFLLMARILREVARGEESEWHPWIESLPRNFSTGIYMDEDERSRLPAMAKALVELQDRQLDAFGAALRLLDDREIRRVLSDDTDAVDDLVKWAFSVVFTRSHRYEVQQWEVSEGDDAGAGEVRVEIVPVGDTFNHREPGDVLWNPDADDRGRFAEFVLREDVILGPDEASRDLHLSYGMSIPHRFLVVFGFVDESTPEVPSQVLFADPTPELIELGCNDPKRMVFRSEDGMIANAVWDCVLYAILSSDPDEQRALFDAHIRGDKKGKAEVHSRHALEVSMALRGHVEEALNSLPDEEGTESAQNEERHSTLSPVDRNNALMRTIFGRVKKRLDAIVENEFRRRMADCGRKEVCS